MKILFTRNTFVKGVFYAEGAKADFDKATAISIKVAEKGVVIGEPEGKKKKDVLDLENGGGAVADSLGGKKDKEEDQPEEEEEVQCAAKAKSSGKRCKGIAVKGSKFCPRHQPAK